ncbi:MAG: hypothetical protein PHC90_09860 [Syntrophorhabdaceae bacterium]|nr:hypothetical protein [Syntrophorhabdaceae bacterium]
MYGEKRIRSLMNPTDLLLQSAKLVTQVEEQVAAIVTAIAFFMGSSRTVFTLYKKGYENIVPYLKDQTGRFMIICALCTPLPFLGGTDGKPGTFIGTFPRMVISAGFTQAGNGKVFDNLNAVKAKLGKEMGSGELSEKLTNIKEASPLTGVKIKWVDAIKVRLAQLIFLLPLIPPSACLAFFHPALGAFMMMIGYVVSEYMAVISSGIGVNVDTGNMVFVLQTVRELVRSYIGAITGFLFHTLLIFTFTGVIITAAVRAAVFCITFPFSVVTMAFDSRREIFFQNIIKAFAIALTPVVAINVLNVLTMAYDLFMSTGITAGMVEAYLFSNIDTLKDSGVFPIAGEMYGFIFRLFIVTVLAPSVLSIPALVFLAGSYRIASEAIGAGLGYCGGMGAGGGGRE